MTWYKRVGVAEALDAAGWTGDTLDPRGLLTHPSGATWAVVNASGVCALDLHGGPTVAFPGKVPDAVVIAACLAAAGQLDPVPTAACDAEGHAIPCTCPEAAS